MRPSRRSPTTSRSRGIIARCSSWMGQAGTPPRTWSCRTALIWCSCPRPPRSYNPSSGSGRSSMSRSRTGRSLTWTRWRRSSSPGARPCAPIVIGSRPTPAFIGGHGNADGCISDLPKFVSVPETQSADIRQGIRPGRSLMSSLARGRQRTPLLPSHPVHQHMSAAGIHEPSLPTRVSANRSIDSRDTPENRFVKHALNDFLVVLLDIESHLLANGAAADLRLIREVTPLRLTIAEYLEASLFKEVSLATVLPLGSPVLQRRSGYREVLESWLKFN